MRHLLFGGLALFFGGATVHGSIASMPEPDSARIAPAWAYQLWQSGSAVLVDVREESEILDGIAAPALWIPTTSIDADPEMFGTVLATFTPSRLIIFYCHSGRRAGLAAALARGLGYQSANMGGYAEWVDAGLPIRQP